MDYIYQEFRRDIEHLRSVLALAESVKSFAGTTADYQSDSQHKYIVSA